VETGLNIVFIEAFFMDYKYMDIKYNYKDIREQVKNYLKSNSDIPFFFSDQYKVYKKSDLFNLDNTIKLEIHNHIKKENNFDINDCDLYIDSMNIIHDLFMNDTEYIKKRSEMALEITKEKQKVLTAMKNEIKTKANESKINNRYNKNIKEYIKFFELWNIPLPYADITISIENKFLKLHKYCILLKDYSMNYKRIKKALNNMYFEELRSFVKILDEIVIDINKYKGVIKKPNVDDLKEIQETEFGLVIQNMRRKWLEEQKVIEIQYDSDDNITQTYNDLMNDYKKIVDSVDLETKKKLYKSSREIQMNHILNSENIFVMDSHLLPKTLEFLMLSINSHDTFSVLSSIVKETGDFQMSDLRNKESLFNHVKNNEITINDNNFSYESLKYLDIKPFQNDVTLQKLLTNNSTKPVITKLIKTFNENKNIKKQMDTIAKYNEIKKIHKEWSVLYSGIKNKILMEKNTKDSKDIQDLNLNELFKSKNVDYILPISKLGNSYISSKLNNYSKLFISVTDFTDLSNDSDILKNHIKNIRSNLNETKLNELINSYETKNIHAIPQNLFDMNLKIKAMKDLIYSNNLLGIKTIDINKYISEYSIVENNYKHTHQNLIFSKNKLEYVQKYKELSEQELRDFVMEYIIATKIELPITEEDLKKYSKEFENEKMERSINRIIENIGVEIDTINKKIEDLNAKSLLLNQKMTEEFNLFDIEKIIRSEYNNYIQKNIILTRKPLDYYKTIKKFIGIIDCDDIKKDFDSITKNYDKKYIIDDESMKKLRIEIRKCLNKMFLDDVEKEYKIFETMLNSLKNEIDGFKLVKCSNDCIEEKDYDHILKIFNNVQSDYEINILTTKYIEELKSLPNDKYIDKDPKLTEKIENLTNIKNAVSNKYEDIIKSKNILDVIKHGNEIIPLFNTEELQNYKNTNTIMTEIKIGNIERYQDLINKFKKEKNIYETINIITELIKMIVRDTQLISNNNLDNFIGENELTNNHKKVRFYKALKYQIMNIYKISQNLDYEISNLYKNNQRPINYPLYYETFIGILMSNVDKILILSSIQAHYDLPLEEYEMKKSEEADIYFKYREDKTIHELRKTKYEELKNNKIFDLLNIEENSLSLLDEFSFTQGYYSDMLTLVKKLDYERKRINDKETNDVLDIDMIGDTIKHYYIEFFKSLKIKSDNNYEEIINKLKNSMDVMNEFKHLFTEINSSNLFDQLKELKPTVYLVDNLKKIYERIYGINNSLQHPDELERKFKLDSIINGRLANIYTSVFNIEDYLQILVNKVIDDNKYYIKNDDFKKISDTIEKHKKNLKKILKENNVKAIYDTYEKYSKELYKSVFYRNPDDLNYNIYKYAYNNLRYNYEYEYEEEKEKEEKVNKEKVKKGKKKELEIDELLEEKKVKKEKKVDVKEEEKAEEKQEDKNIIVYTGKKRDFYFNSTIRSKFIKDYLFGFGVNSKMVMVLLPYMNYLDSKIIEQYKKTIVSSISKNVEIDEYLLPIIKDFQSRKMPEEKYNEMYQKYDELNDKLKSKLKATRLKIDRDILNEEEIFGKIININSQDYKYSFIIDLFTMFDDKTMVKDTDNEILLLKTMVNDLSNISSFIVDNYQSLINVTIDENKYVMNKSNNYLALFGMYKDIFYKKDIIIKDSIKTEYINKLTKVPYGLKDNIKVINQPSVFYTQIMTDISIMKEKVKNDLNQYGTIDRNSILQDITDFSKLNLLKNNVLRFILNIIETIGNKIGEDQKSKYLFYDYVFRFININDVNRKIIIQQKRDIHAKPRITTSFVSSEKIEKYKHVESLLDIKNILEKINKIETVDNDVTNVYEFVIRKYS